MILPVFAQDPPAQAAGLSPMWAFWALTLCLAGAVLLVFSVKLRRALGVLLSSAPLLFGSAMLLILERGAPAISENISLPLLASAYALIGCVSVVTALLLRHIRRTKISPMSIAESFDRLSSGVCFFYEGGRCVLVNEQMRKISFALTGHTLRSGEEFLRALPPDRTVALPDGKTYSLNLRAAAQNGGTLYELTAADVTEYSEKSARLRRENGRLSRLNAGLRAYSERIGEHARQNEILRAKIGIHDEMNELLLKTQIAIERGDREEMRAALKLWQSRALLLTREREENKATDAIRDLKTLAASLGLTFECGDPPERGDGVFWRLFTHAAREAMINAVKHARAKTLYVGFEDLPGATAAVFRNDGALPSGEVAPRGGLTVLKTRIKEAGGALSISTDGGFALTVTIPKGETPICPAGF